VTPDVQNPENLKDFQERLRRSVLKPVFAAILKSSWWTRAFVLIGIFLAGIGWTNRSWVLEHARYGWALPRAMINSDSLALDWKDRELLQNAIDQLSTYLGSELVQAEDQEDTNPNHNAWGIAQLAIALNQTNSAEVVHRAIESRKNVTCHCWTEYGENGPPHTATMNWVVYAFGRLDKNLDADELDQILQGQHQNGWWSAYPSVDDAQYASTYATAWSILALDEQLKAGLIAAAQKVRVRQSIDSGLAWLIGQNANDAAWADYPYAPPGLQHKSVGVSGLILHVLHHFGRASTSMDRTWLRGLPKEIPNSQSSDAYPYQIKLISGRTSKDGVRQLQLPWMIIATVDAYPSGDVFDRAGALVFIEKVPDSLTRQLPPVMSGTPWAAAEFEISLRYLVTAGANRSSVI
jgi:hypothetical protein